MRELKTFRITVLAHDPKMPDSRDVLFDLEDPNYPGKVWQEGPWQPVTVERKAVSERIALGKVLDLLFDHGLVPLEKPTVEEVK